MVDMARSSDRGGVLDIVFRGDEASIPYPPGCLVSGLRENLARTFGIPAASFSFALRGGSGSGAAPLPDSTALSSLPADAVVHISETVSLRDVAAGAAALIADYAPTAIFIAAIPLVLYLGLVRRGAPIKTLRDVLRLPFSD